MSWNELWSSGFLDLFNGVDLRDKLDGNSTCLSMSMVGAGIGIAESFATYSS